MYAYTLPQQIQQTAHYLDLATQHFLPQVGIVLGTGLGGLANEIVVSHALPYDQIPHFATSTVESHSGRLLFGTLGGKRVVAMQGRFHHYEGYDMQQITFPVRVMKALGVTHLLLSNAAGSTAERLRSGSMMIINDHINLQPTNPLVGKNFEELGIRFPDMSQPYDPQMIAAALRIAQQYHLPCQTGVYAAISGPNLETRAEYAYLNRIGADAVGMSTVPEVIVAVHSGLRVFAVSAITDEGYPSERLKKLALSDIIATAKVIEPHLALLITELLKNID